MCSVSRAQQLSRLARRDFLKRRQWKNTEMGGCVPYSCEDEQNDNQASRIGKLAKRLGYKQAKTQMLLGQYTGKLDTLEQKLTNLLSAASQDACSSSQSAR
jgi:hypothetical protein